MYNAFYKLLLIFVLLFLEKHPSGIKANDSGAVLDILNKLAINFKTRKHLNMADATVGKQRSVGSSSSQSQQSKLLSTVTGEPLESKFTSDDLQMLENALKVVYINQNYFLCLRKKIITKLTKLFNILNTIINDC